MNGEDITQFNIRSFYDHSRRRRTTLAKYIFLLQINKDRERSEHLIGGKKNMQLPVAQLVKDVRICECVNKGVIPFANRMDRLLVV